MKKMAAFKVILLLILRLEEVQSDYKNIKIGKNYNIRKDKLILWIVD